MNCNQCFNNKPIIKFQFEGVVSNKVFCLDCLVEWLDKQIEKQDFYIMLSIKKIIPIYNF